MAKKEAILLKQSPMHTIIGDNHFNIVGATIIANQVLQALGVLRLCEP